MNPVIRRTDQRAPRHVVWFWIRTWLLGLSLLAATAAPLAAQDSSGRVTVISVDDEAFPRVSLFVDVFTPAGTPVLDLTPNSISLTEDQQPATIQSVTADTSQPLALLLALDRSTNDAASWVAVQTAAQAMIAGLRDQDQVSLMTVDDQVTVVQPFTTDKAAAIAALTAVTSIGNVYSAINPAVVQAVQQFNAGLPQRRAIVLVADRPDNTPDTISTLTADAAVAQIAGAGVPVSVVGYGSLAQNDPEFAQFAAATGGRSLSVADANALQVALASLLTDLQQGYRIDFVSGLTADNAAHTALLQVNGRTVTGSATAQFTARGGTVTVSLPGLNAGQPVAGVVNVTAEATAPGAIANVEYQVDGQPIGSAGPGEPVAWDTTTFAPGTHTVRAVVTDTSGNTGEASVDVLVAAGSTRLDLPAVDGAAFPRVAAYVDVYGPNGLPVAGLDGRSFALTEGDRPIDSAQVSAQVDASQPLQLVLVLDRSVAAADWTQLRNAASGLTDKLRPQDQAAIYAFAGGVALVQPPTSDHDALRNALASIEAVPPATQSVADNSLFQAILDATNLAASLPSGRRSVIVLTNGLDNTGQISIDQLTQQLQTRTIPVHLLGFGVDGATAGALAGLAQLTGGNSVTVGGAAELRSPMQTLLQLIEQGYRLEYVSTLPADDQPHSVSVKLAAAGLEAQAEGTFIAARRPVTVTILGVGDGATLGGQVDLGAQAESPAQVVTVDYRLNGETLAQTQDIGALVRWNSETVTPGEYTLEVVVTDAVGNQGRASVSFNVVPPVTVAASLDARNSDGDIVVGDPVTVKAAVTVLSGGATVEFYVGNVLVGTDDRAPYEARIDSGQFEPGNQTVTVVARDDTGHQAVSSLDLTFAAPPTPTPNATEVAAASRSTGLGAALPDVSGINWGRWLGIGGLIAVVLGLLAVIMAALRSVRVAAATKKLTPMRLALSNLGNTATAYLLRGDDPEGALSFRFSFNGQTLGRPPVARLTQDDAVAGAGRRPGVGLPGVPASVGGMTMPTNLSGIGEKMGEISAFAQIISSVLMSVSYLLPPSLARPLRMLTMQLRRGQMITRRVESVRKQVGKLNKKVAGASADTDTGDEFDEMEPAAAGEPVGQAVAASGSTTPGSSSTGAAVSAAAGTAVAGAGRAANKLFDLTATATRQVGDQAAALIGANGAGGRQWVYLPPVNPGETVTIDVMVGAVGKLAGNKHMTFRLLSKAVDDEHAQPVVEEGSVRVTGSSPWQGLTAWLVIALAVLVAAVLAWWLLGLIF